MTDNLSRLGEAVRLLEQAIEVRGGLPCHGLEGCLKAVPRISRTRIDWSRIGYAKREPLVVSEGFARALEMLSANMGAENYAGLFKDDLDLVFGPDLKIQGSASFLEAWRGCSRMVEMSDDIDFSRAVTMSRMLYNCLSLRSFNAAGYTVTSTVTDLSEAFYGCTMLAGLAPGGWDVSNVTSLKGMFEGCASLVSLDLSGWAGKVGRNRSVEGLFQGCSSLSDLTLPPGLIHAGITSISGMLGNTSSLRSLDLSGWDVSNVTNLSAFIGCGLRDLSALRGWNVTEKAVAWNFQGCAVEGTLDLSTWEINLPSGRYCFQDCSSLRVLDLSNMVAVPVKEPALSRANYFRGCAALETVRLPARFVGPEVTGVDSMFSGCSSLAELDASSWDLSGVSTINNLFNGCASLPSVSTAGWRAQALINISNSFQGCSSLRRLDISSWSTAGVISMTGAFRNCSALEEITGLLDMSAVADPISVNLLFTGCSSLREVRITGLRHTLNLQDSPLSAESVHSIIEGASGQGIRISLSSAAYSAWDTHAGAYADGKTTADDKQKCAQKNITITSK